MHDDTTRVPRANGAPDDSPTRQRLRHLDQALSELMELLRNQRDVLKTRGMNLPTGALDTLRTLRMRLDQFKRQQNGTLAQLQQLRALAETTALINSEQETDAVLNAVMDEVVRLTKAERGYIVLINPETGALDEFRVARGIDRAQLEASDDNNPRIVSKTIVEDVARTGEPVLTDNASQDARYQDQKSVVGFALRSILAVPLKLQDEVIGVVYCDNRIQAGLFQSQHKDLLTAFAHQAAVAIQNARLFEAVRYQLAEVTEMRDLRDNTFASITNGVLTVSHTGHVLTCNAAALYLLGIADDITGARLRDVMPSMPQEFYEAMNNCLNTGTQHTAEVSLLLAEDDKHYWNLIISALRDAEGHRQGLAIVIDDVTEEHRHKAIMEEVELYLPPVLIKNIRSIDDVNVSGEERFITAMSCDVRGFTTFSELLEPEDLMAIINKYLSVASDAINFYEGIVDKYMGDAVTGLFNTQLNEQPDHPARAVRTALNIIYDLQALHEVLPEEQRLFYGIGIHSGTAFLGNLGGADRKEFSAIGDATILSKILEANAGPGEIIISPATYALVEDQFECEPRTPEKKKGRQDLELVYRVLRRKRGTTSTFVVAPELGTPPSGEDNRPG